MTHVWCCVSRRQHLSDKLEGRTNQGNYHNFVLTSGITHPTHVTRPRDSPEAARAERHVHVLSALCLQLHDRRDLFVIFADECHDVGRIVGEFPDGGALNEGTQLLVHIHLVLRHREDHVHLRAQTKHVTHKVDKEP